MNSIRWCACLAAALGMGACSSVGSRAVIDGDGAKLQQPGFNRITQAGGGRTSDAASTVPQTWTEAGNINSIGAASRLTGALDLSTPEGQARSLILDSGGTARVRIERVELPADGTLSAQGVTLDMSSAEATRAQNEALAPITDYMARLTQEQRQAIEAVAPGLLGVLQSALRGGW